MVVKRTQKKRQAIGAAAKITSVYNSMPRQKRKRPKNRRGRGSPGHGECAAKPITDDYIRNTAGMTGTKGKLLKR